MMNPFLNSSVTNTNVSFVNTKCSLAGVVDLDDLKLYTMRSTRMNNLRFHDRENANVGCSYLHSQSDTMQVSIASLTDIHHGSMWFVMLSVPKSSEDKDGITVVAINGSESDF